MKRYAPYIEGLTQELLKTDTELAGVTIGTQLVPNFLEKLPFVFLESSGGSAINEKLAFYYTLQVTSVARGDKRAAADLDEAVRAALYDAWKSQRTNEHGSLARLRTSVKGYEERLDNQPLDVYRYYAVYELTARPPRTP